MKVYQERSYSQQQSTAMCILPNMCVYFNVDILLNSPLIGKQISKCVQMHFFPLSQTYFIFKTIAFKQLNNCFPHLYSLLISCVHYNHLKFIYIR